MLKKTINYIDYNGKETSEDCYFNLTKLELTRLNLNAGKKGLAEVIKKAVHEDDNKTIFDLFETLILKAYGEKSEDGKRFIKSEELSLAFSQSPAYEALFDEITRDDKAAADFMNAVIPEIPENK